MHLPANTLSSRHESRGASASTSGTLVTAGSSNAKGSYASIGIVNFDYEGFTVYLFANNTAADYILDIAVGSVGNETILVENLYFSGRNFVNESNLQVYFPIHVPFNQFMVARCSSSTNGATCQILVVGHTSNPGGHPGYSRAVALYTPGTSRGIAVDNGGTANTKGSWVQMTASLPVAIDGIGFTIGCNGNVSRTSQQNCLIDIGIGGAGSEQIVIPDLHIVWDGGDEGPLNGFQGFMPLKAAAGQRLAVRQQTNNNTAGDRVFDIAPLGLAA